MIVSELRERGGSLLVGAGLNLATLALFAEPRIVEFIVGAAFLHVRQGRIQTRLHISVTLGDGECVRHGLLHHVGHISIGIGNFHPMARVGLVANHAIKVFRL